jgi:hypothetical protein
VTEGAGSYDLVVHIDPPNGATYTVTVEDCTGSETTTPPPETTTPPPETTSPPPTTSPMPTTSPAPGQGPPGPDSECPGARVVNTTTGTGDKQSPVFGISGDSFRVTTTLRSGDPRFLFFSADVNKEGRGFVTSIGRESTGTDSSIVNSGPGRFFLDILAANTEYTITVEDCAGSTTGTGPGGPGNQGPVNNPKGVVPNTTAKKLPNTGGPSYLAVGAMLALGAAVVAGRGALRR